MYHSYTMIRVLLVFYVTRVLFSTIVRRTELNHDEIPYIKTLRKKRAKRRNEQEVLIAECSYTHVFTVRAYLHT
jgi:hypothetical protein